MIYVVNDAIEEYLAQFCIDDKLARDLNSRKFKFVKAKK